MFGSSFCLARAKKSLSRPLPSFLGQPLTAAEPGEGGDRKSSCHRSYLKEMRLPATPVLPGWSMTPPGGRDCGLHYS